MEQVLKIATSVSTPLALAGLIAAILFLILKQLIAKGIIRIKEQHSYNIITLIVERLFVLSLVALCLGFAGYVVAQYRNPLPGPSITSTNGPSPMVTVAPPMPKRDDELDREAADRVRAFRARFSLCKLGVDPTDIAVVDAFTNQLATLNNFVNPKYEKHGFVSVVSELRAVSPMPKQAALLKATDAFEHLPDEARLLRQYVHLFATIDNDHGGATYLHESRLQCIKILELLERLRAPWTNGVEPFPNSCW